MKFLLEEINLEEIKQLYFLRGYEGDEDNSYCTSMVLIGNNDDEFKITLFLSQKTLSITDMKGFLEYLKKAGMSWHAEVLESDFDKFYDKRSFKKVRGQ